MYALLQDLRYSLRFLLKAPAFTVPALLTLALGVGANTAMLSVANAVMWRPMPGIRDPGALAWVASVDRRTGRRISLTTSELREIAALGAFDGVAASAPAALNLAGRGDAERVAARLANADYFRTLGVVPALGRFFLDTEDRAAAGEPVAVISWEFWQRRFGGDAGVLGQRLLLNGHTFTVIGVAPRGFIGVELADHPPVVWPLAIDAAGTSPLLQDRWTLSLELIGRLREGVTLQQASAALEPLAARLESDDPASTQEPAFRVTPVRGGVGPADRGDALSAALVGFAVTAAVLLIACANVAGLLLARASRREREIGMRIALGASRGRLVRQLLTENAVLAVAAGCGGLLLAWWGTGALVAALDVPLPLDVGPDVTVLAGTLVVSLTAVLAFGMVPALNVSRPDVAPAIAGGTVAGPARPRARLQRRFVVAQVALSLVLLATAGMLLRHLHQTSAADGQTPDPDRLLVASFDLAGQGYSPERQRAFARNLLERLERMGPVESASIAALVPLGGMKMATSVQPGGAPAAPGSRQPRAFCNWVGPAYFRTVGSPIVKGRAFTDADVPGSAPVVIVNETLAKQLWPGQDPVGKRLRAWRDEATVIGVAADSRYDAADEAPLPFVFFPAGHNAPTRVATGIVVRARHDAAALLPVVRSAVAELDPAIPVFDARTMKTLIAERRASQRAASVVLDLFGVLALLLTAIGVYGVMAYAVERRTREIGVRVALGAQARDILRLLLREGASLASFGVAVGLFLAVVATRAFSSFSGIEPAGPALLAAVSTLVVATMFAACWVPARRATHVDATVALRSE